MKKTIAQVSVDGKLKLPPEIEVQLKPLAEYEVLVKDGEILLKPISKSLTWEELKQLHKELGTDPDQPTLEQISQMIKDIRAEI